MDATDHENIPSPGKNNGLSSWMHIGFDYLKQVETRRTSVQMLNQGAEHSKSEEISAAVGKKSMPEPHVFASQNSKIDHCKSKMNYEDSSLESSASSTNSSPAVSPQGSPSLKRRQEYNLLSSNAQPVSCYNPITWIYKGIFSQESELQNPTLMKVTCVHKDSLDGNKKNRKSLSSDCGRRKYIITNFDINALSPQSW